MFTSETENLSLNNILSPSHKPISNKIIYFACVIIIYMSPGIKVLGKGININANDFDH